MYTHEINMQIINVNTQYPFPNINTFEKYVKVNDSYPYIKNPNTGKFLTYREQYLLGLLKLLTEDKPNSETTTNYDWLTRKLNINHQLAYRTLKRLSFLFETKFHNKIRINRKTLTDILIIKRTKNFDEILHNGKTLESKENKYTEHFFKVGGSSKKSNPYIEDRLTKRKKENIKEKKKPPKLACSSGYLEKPEQSSLNPQNPKRTKEIAQLDVLLQKMHTLKALKINPEALKPMKQEDTPYLELIKTLSTYFAPDRAKEIFNAIAFFEYPDKILLEIAEGFELSADEKETIRVGIRAVYGQQITITSRKTEPKSSILQDFKDKILSERNGEIIVTHWIDKLDASVDEQYREITLRGSDFMTGYIKNNYSIILERAANAAGVVVKLQAESNEKDCVTFPTQRPKNVSFLSKIFSKSG